MRHHIATLCAALLVIVVDVRSKELPAIVTYTVSPSEIAVAREESSRAAIETDSLAAKVVEGHIHPTRTRSDAGRSRKTDDINITAVFERGNGDDGVEKENVKILQNYAVTNFNNNLSTTRSTTESVIELLDRLRNLPPEESGDHLEALGSGTERAETDDDALQLLNEWRENVRFGSEGGQTKESTTLRSFDELTTTAVLLADVLESQTSMQDSYITTEESNSFGSNSGIDLQTTEVLTDASIVADATTTVVNTVTTFKTTIDTTTTDEPTIATTLPNKVKSDTGYVTSKATTMNKEIPSTEKSLVSSTESSDIEATELDEATFSDIVKSLTTPSPTTKTWTNPNGNILIPNVPLVAVGGGTTKEMGTAEDKDNSGGGGGAAFWDSRVEIAVVSAAAVLLCLVLAAALITYCVCRSHFHRKNIYTTMEVEPRPQFFTKPGPPVILRHEVEERRGLPQAHAPPPPCVEAKERQKVTEL